MTNKEMNHCLTVFENYLILTSPILVAFDSSGSIAFETHKKYLEAISRIRNIFRNPLNRVVYFSHQIEDEQPLAEFKEKRIISGGTDFQNVIDYAQKHRFPQVVIITDGVAPTPVVPKGMSVLWIMVPDMGYPIPPQLLDNLPGKVLLI